jgi:RimJ/RimL family protein N-acetyltransferase
MLDLKMSEPTARPMPPVDASPVAEPPPRPVPTLRAARVYLRPAEKTDLERFVRWFADGEVTRYLALRAPFSLAMEERWFEQMIAGQGKRDYHFVICLVEDDTPIGTAGLHGINGVEGNAEFGISIGEKAYWNRGYGTESLHAICDFAFGALRLERIQLQVYTPNTRAVRSYEKAGFVLEGTQRHALFAEGEFVDVHVMSLLRDEWRAQVRPKSWDVIPSQAPTT